MDNFSLGGLDLALKDEFLILRAVKSKKGVMACLKERGYGDNKFLFSSDEPNLKVALVDLDLYLAWKKSPDTSKLLGRGDNLESWVYDNGVLRAYASEGKVLLESASFYGDAHVDAIGANLEEAYWNLNTKLRGHCILSNIESQRKSQAELDLLNEMRKVAWSS